MDREKQIPTEEEKALDEKAARRAYKSNATKTYEFKNRGLEIKISSMEILYKRLQELDGMIDSQNGSEKLSTLAVMADLGKAIIPD